MMIKPLPNQRAHLRPRITNSFVIRRIAVPKSTYTSLVRCRTVSLALTVPDTVTPAQPSLSAEQTRGRPGSSFRVRGRGYAPGANLSVQINGRTIATLRSDEAGSFALLVRTTADTPPGSYTITIGGTGLAAGVWPSLTLVLDPGAALHSDVPGPGDIEVRVEGQQELYLPLLQR